MKPIGVIVLSICLILVRPVRGEVQPVSEWKISNEELARYYDGKGKPPPWPAAVDVLFSEDPAKAAEAGRFLMDLVAQVLADETSGTSRWHATPYWGSEGENPARNLREYMVLTLAEHAEKGCPHPSALLPLLEWFIRKEPVVNHRLGAMRVLVKLGGKEADVLVQSLAADASLIHWLAASAIQRATARDLDLPETALRTALSGHHADRRDAAAVHWKKQFGSEPAAFFVPAEAVQSPEIGEFLDAFGALVIDPLPADAPWVAVDRSWKQESNDNPELEVETTHGWLVKRERDLLRILDLHGRIIEFTLGENPNKGWPFAHLANPRGLGGMEGETQS